MGLLRKISKTMVWGFGGGGGGAAGSKKAHVTLYGAEATFELIGSFDVDPYACAAFKYMTGVEQICIDIREMTPQMMRDIFGDQAPWVIKQSPPCQGASKLLSTAKSLQATYVLLNELCMVSMRLIVETWAPYVICDGKIIDDKELKARALADLPAFFFVENVPNITSRARPMLTALRKFFTDLGMVTQDGYHECRHVGDLAQKRKRWFFLVRNPFKVPSFLYLPPKKKGKVCGDVLGELPMPGDPAGGAMHVLPAISALNWWRLWKIPAGGDWRDLLPDDGTPRRARFRRHHVEKWDEPSVTIGGSGSNGPCGIADPGEGGARWFNGAYGMTDWNSPTKAVISGPSNGAAFVADPRAERFHHVDHVTPWTSYTGTVTHSPAPSSGAIAVAFPLGQRFKDCMGVLAPSAPSGTVTGEAYPSTGAFAYADDRSFDGPHGVLRQDHGAPRADWFSGDETRWHHTVLGVLSATGIAPTITGQGRIGGGAFAYADARGIYAFATETRWHPNILGVLSPLGVAGTVTGHGHITGGAFAYADRRVLDLRVSVDNPHAHRNKYVVTWAGGPAGTVIGATHIGGGAPSYADPRVDLARERPGFNSMDHVLGWNQAAKTVTGATRPGNGAPSAASPIPLFLLPQSGNPDRMHWGKYVVVPMNGSAPTVTGADRVGSGAVSIAQPLEVAVKDSAFHAGPGIGRLGVLSSAVASSTVTGNARIATGPFNYAAPVPLVLIPTAYCYDKAYAVLDTPNEPSHTVAGTTAVGCGAYARTDAVPAEGLRLALGCTPFSGSYGVAASSEPFPTVIAEAQIDKGMAAIADPTPPRAPFVILSYEEARRVADGEIVAPFAIVDPADPEHPLAIIDDMKKPPYRWVEYRDGRGKLKRRKEVVPLILISEDGTWHRPLTTLELAVLQGLPWMLHGAPLDFGGGSTKQRETIGNMIPMPVGAAVGDQMLAAGIAADLGCFFLSNGGGGIWVRPEYLDELTRAGVLAVRQQDAHKVPRGTLVILSDDARPYRRRPAPRSDGARAAAAARSQVVARAVLSIAKSEQRRDRTPRHSAARAATLH